MSEFIIRLNSLGEAFIAWMVPTLVQSSLLVLCLLFLDLALRRRVRAVTRYWIWMLVLLKLLLPPSLSTPVSLVEWTSEALPRALTPLSPKPDMSSAQLSRTVARHDPTLAVPPLSTTTPGRPVFDSANALSSQGPLPLARPTLHWRGIAVLAWGTMVLSLALFLLRRHMMLVTLTSRSIPPASHLMKQLQHCCRAMHVTRKVNLRVTALCAGPSISGLFKPTILLPEKMATNLEGEQLNVIFLHELAHLKRGDLWANLLQTLLQMLYFFHPLLWVANALIRRVRELAVDETVLATMGDGAEDYPQTLLDISKVAAGPSVFGLRLLGVVESEKALMGRMKHMTSRPFPKSARVGVLGCILILAIAVLFLPMARSQAEQATDRESARASNTQKDRQADPVEMLELAVEIINEDGQPVKNATIIPYALRATPDTGHALWPRKIAKPMIVTNSFGRAQIPFPKYLVVSEKLLTSEVTIRIEHPEYVPLTKHLETRNDRTEVVLNHGVTLSITAWRDEPQRLISQKLWIISREIALRRLQRTSRDTWIGDGIVPGDNGLLLVHEPNTGPLFFSDLAEFSATSGTTQDINLELSPGVTLRGRISDNVPRSIESARALVRVYALPGNGARPMPWTTEVDVNPDGTFTFASLPRGRAEVLVVMDDWVIENPPDRRDDSRRHPHMVSAQRSENLQPIECVISMIPAATAQVHVMDRDGNPVVDATVSFWPNMKWDGGGSQLLGVHLPRMEDLIASNEELDRRWWDDHRAEIPQFSATTNGQGLAVITDLPPGELMFAIEHDSWQLPITTRHSQKMRTATVTVVSGSTTQTSVTVIPTGTDFLGVDVTAAPWPAPATNSSEDRSGPAYEPLAVKPEERPDYLMGHILDGQGLPIAGALVDARHWYPGNETNTYDDGSFRLENLDPDERVEVTFHAEGYSPRYIVVQPLGTLAEPVILTKDTYLRGTVRDAHGQPVSQAKVLAQAGPFHADGVMISERAYKTTTGEDGHYRLYLQADTYEVFVHSPSGNARLPNVQVGRSQVVTRDIGLVAGAVFRAHAIDSITGEPVSGVRLYNWRRREFEGTSNEEGLIEIAGMFTGPFEFNIEGPDLARWWSDQSLKEWQKWRIDLEKQGWQRNFDDLEFDIITNMDPVTIVVERGVRIRGRVLDPDGNPVPGATVAPALTGTGNSLTGDTRFSFKTDDQGEYDGLFPAGHQRQWNLIAHDGKFQEWRHWANGVTEPFTTQAGQRIDGLELHLTQPATVQGQAVSQSGEPVKHARVRASAQDRRGNRYYDPTTETDNEGRFTLRFVRAGGHFIQVEPFWLNANEAPNASSKLVELQSGETMDIGTLIQVKR